jgi:predicted DNA-binding protein
MKSHSLTIRLEADLERELEAVCVETGRSRGDIVRDALHRQLQRMRFERLRAQGMRPIQIWVPDVYSPEFAAEARRQSLLVAQSPEEADMQAFIDSVDEWPDAETSQ